MHQDLYTKLLTQFCEQADEGTAGQLLHGTGMTVNGIPCSIDFRDHTTHPKLLVYCDFGPLPAENKNNILIRLMEANLYLFSTQQPGFSSQSVFTISTTGHVLLSETYPLSDLTTQRLREVLDSLSKLALDWKKDYFLSRIDAPAASDAFELHEYRL